MRPASRLLPPRLGAFFEMARLRKQGVATMMRIRPQAEPATAGRRLSSPPRSGEEWIGPKDRDGEGAREGRNVIEASSAALLRLVDCSAHAQPLGTT